MAKKKKSSKKRRSLKKTAKGVAVMLVLAGLFLGIGTGMIFGNPGAGTLMGLGLGFWGAYRAVSI